MGTTRRDWAFDLLASFDRFVPPELTDPSERRRSQLTVLFSAVGAVTGCALAVIAPFLDLNWAYTAIFFAVALLVALIPFIVRATRSTTIGAHLFSFGWMAAVGLGMYTRGGIDNVVAPCLAPLPLIATVLGGHRAGVLWLVASIGAIVGFGVAPSLGIPLNELMPVEFHQTYAYVTISTLLVMLLLFASAFIALEAASTRKVDAAVKEQKAAENEAQMLRAGRLAALGEVAGSLAHEINNPLMYVMANLEFILEDEALSENVREAGVDAQEGTERIASIVKDLKAYATSDDEAVEVVDLAVVAQSTVRLVHGYLRKRAQLELGLDSCPPIDGNWAQLSQVVINLVVNAAQAAASKDIGKNRVALRTGVDDSERAFLEVEDNGRGIPADVLERITEPFFTTDVGVRTGLGLLVTKNIVDGLGGTLEIESSVDVGTRVRVSFTPAVIDEVTNRRITLVREKALSVLLIDRDPLVAAALRRMLSEHEVAVAESTLEASGLLDIGLVPDLVLLDTQRDGEAWAWFQQVRADHPHVERRVIFMAGGTGLDEAPDVLAEMPDRLVLKPLGRDRLASLIDKHISPASVTELIAR